MGWILLPEESARKLDRIDSSLEPKEETRDERIESILLVRLLDVSRFVQEGRPSYQRTLPFLFVERNVTKASKR